MLQGILSPISCTCIFKVAFDHSRVTSLELRAENFVGFHAVVFAQLASLHSRLEGFDVSVSSNLGTLLACIKSWPVCFVRINHQGTNMKDLS